SRGIGAAIARELAVAGARVALAGREEATLRQVAASLPDESAAVTVTADVSSTSDLDRLVAQVVDRLGGVDVLVNNAGLLPPAKQIYKADVDEWQQVMDVNLRAPWYLSKLIHPHMRARGGCLPGTRGSPTGCAPARRTPRGGLSCASRRRAPGPSARRTSSARAGSWPRSPGRVFRCRPCWPRRTNRSWMDALSSCSSMSREGAWRTSRPMSTRGAWRRPLWALCAGCTRSPCPPSA